MEVAQLVLEYIRVLVWPLILVLGVLVYRKQIVELLRKLPDEGSAEIPMLGKYSWKRRIDEVAADSAQLPLPRTAEAASNEEGAQASPPESTVSAFERRAELAAAQAGLGGCRDWSALRELAISAPVAGVLDCWRTVAFLVYALAYQEKAPLGDSWQEDMGRSAAYLGAPAQVAAVLADLKDLNDEAAKGAHVTRSGALSFIDTAEQAVASWLGLDWAKRHLERYGRQ